MFGHQDDQDHHHHDDDNKPMGDVLSDPVMGDVLSTEQHGATIVSGDGGDFNPALPASDSAAFGDQPAQDAPVTSSDSTPEPVTSAPVSSDLLSIKQQALTALSPLVDHLDQTSEEKFRTTMMMIQASDNQDLIKVAYDAAQAITDEKVKAQALLDIVNEINYFTQQAA